jgi:uncharacterized protein
MPAAVAVVDTGPLLAAADESDPDHTDSVSLFSRRDMRFVIPTAVATEAAQLIGRRLGPAAEAAFHRALASQDVEPPTPADYERIAELVDDYSDFPLGGVDASVIAIAERLDASAVLTLDRRHFSAVRPKHRESLELLPE